MTARAGTAGLVLLAGLALALLAPARPAAAHPLGNFSANQLESLRLYPDRVEVAAVVDLAELPTLQERPAVDVDGDGTASAAERAAHAGRRCADLAAGFAVTAAGDSLQWTVTVATFGYAPGSAGLATSRLECALRAPARLAAPATVSVDNRYLDGRIGWRELTAVGYGVDLPGSPLPTRSVSDGLRTYAADLLTSPLDVRTARLSVRPAGAGLAGVAATGPATPAPAGGTGPAWSRWAAAGARALGGLVAGARLTPLAVLVALGLAVALGAGHAALPGHGKTVMAVYLAGRAGRVRDAYAVAATVTLTHTGSVLALGALLTGTAAVAGEAVLGWLGAASGILVAAVGTGMLVAAIRGRPGHDHGHGGRPGHDHGYGGRPGHEHPHEHGHGHDHEQGHDHGRPPEPSRPGRLGLLGIGLAGGLVPSPSALVVLLGAAGVGRAALGVLLVLGYGVGMAATLTAAGFALVRVRRRWRYRPGGYRWLAVPARWAHRVGGHGRTASAVAVLGLGLALAGRALLGAA